MTTTSAERFYHAMGGRKQLNGYIFSVLITVMVFPLKGTFMEYSVSLGGALLGTSWMVAREERAGAPRNRRTDDPKPAAGPPRSDG